MTFSIVACDPPRGDWGVAVASKFPAVGSVVPWARSGAGAIATQSYANVTFGPEGLDLLVKGTSAQDALDALIAADDGRDQRQVGVVDASGWAATYTGPACMEWAGGVTGEGFACQGNILVGRQVVEAMADAFKGTDGELVDRMLAALKAGDDAGGDRRGKQSAAVLVVRAGGGYDRRNDRYVDLRVDDHEEPVAELLRIFDLYDRTYLIRSDTLLTPSPELIEEIQRRLVATGNLQGAPTGRLDQATRDALATFAGHYNLESKAALSENGVYESIVRELRDITPGVAAGS